MDETQENTNDQEEAKEYPKPPPGITVLPNGAGRDIKTGHFKHPPGTYGPAPKQITKDNASAMAKRRHQKTKEAIASAIVERAQQRGLNVLTPSDAIGHAAGTLFDDILDGAGTLRDRNTTLWSIGKYSDLVESQDKHASTQTNVQVNITADALREILSMISLIRMKRTGGCPRRRMIC